jgi:hypothetical protein
MRDDVATPAREWHSDTRTPIVASLGLAVASGGLFVIIVVSGLGGFWQSGVGPAVGGIAFAVVLLLFCLWSLTLLRARLGERLSVGDYGVRFRGVGGTVEIAWSDIHAARLGVGYIPVLGNGSYFTPRAMQRVARPHLDIAVGRDLTARETRVLRPTRIADPDKNSYTHSFGIVEARVFATGDADSYATTLQELLPLVAGERFSGIGLDDPSDA